MEQINKRLMNWASILEDGAREQAVNTSQMPFIYPHLALMPDAHWGMGATVGSVIPTLGAIIPAAVGVDIGCGMMALRLDLLHSEIEATGLDLDDLRTRIEKVIPLSAGNYNTGYYNDGTKARIKDLENTRGIESAERIAPNWDLQLGSLGSGNHFIEVCKDEEGLLWLFLHSGSRGVGNKLAQKHIKVAQDLCSRWYIDLPDKDLAYLIEGTPEFGSYITDLHWAQKFALLNRVEMMERVKDAFDDWAGGVVETSMEVNCHHNYTSQEKHWGKDVWLSRKGAIDASEGKVGLIPGSMGDLSYVVKGKGNRLSLNSSPHGAGRNHSRGKARKMFTHDDLRQRMEGISWRDSDAFLDEHPQAYKPIDQVMADADDLVTVVHTLKQIVNVKGE